jgi:hypothetical protein
MPRQNSLRLLIYTVSKLKDKKEKQIFSGDGYHWKGEHIRKG